jgi:hypothetical protein
LSSSVFADDHDLVSAIDARDAAAGDAPGYVVVVEHGRLTALDAGLVAEAKSHMDGAV